MSYENEYQKIRVSKRAYFALKELAKKDKYRGRGITGAFDDVILGEFTTSGSGNYTNNIGARAHKNKQKKS